MRTPINIAEIYSGFERLSSQLPPSSLLSVRSVLQSAPPGVLRLSFVPLRPGTTVEIHSDSMYVDARQHTLSQDEGVDDCLWVVIDRASDTEVVSDVAAADPQMSSGFDLAELLEAFDYFAPLTRIPEIGMMDPGLAVQVAAIQRLRPVRGADLHGELLSLHPPVVLGCSAPCTLCLGALAPLDVPPTDHIRLRMSAGVPDRATFVVLGRNPIKLDPDPTVRLTRVR